MLSKRLSPCSIMKLIAFIAIAYSTGANAQCNFCSDGLSVDPTTEIPSSGGDTCGYLAETAPTLEDDEYFCTVTKMAEGVCCPTINEDGGGSTANDDDVEEQEEQEEDDDEEEEEDDNNPNTNTNNNSATSTTTSNNSGIKNPCPICSNAGISVPGTTIINESDDGTTFTCGGLIVDAMKVEDDGEVCVAMMTAEALCCPDDDGDDDSDDDSDDDGDDDSDEDAAATPQQNTDPPPSELLDTTTGEDNDNSSSSSCSVCSSGLTVDGTTIIPYDEAMGASCDVLLVLALDYPEDSDACSEMKNAQDICCPEDDVTPVSPQEIIDGAEDEEDNDDNDDNDEDDEDGEDVDDGSCPVCTGGLTVDPDTIIPYDEAQGASCRDMLGYASDTPADRGDCIEMKKAQVICCPNTAAVDADDAVVDGDAADIDDVTDVVDAVNPTTSNGNNAASTDAAAAADAIEKPCPVCTMGITVDGSTVINESDDGRKFTCGGMILDALNVEEDSGICQSMMTAEVLCCPAIPDDDEEENEDETAPEIVEDITATTTDDDPCPVCSEGITVPGTTIISESGGITRTCGGLVVDAFEVDVNSRICEGMMTAEALCCPTNDDGDFDDEATTTEPTTPTYIEEIISSAPTIAPITNVGYPSLAPKATTATAPGGDGDPDANSSEEVQTQVNNKMPTPVPTVSLSSYDPTAKKVEPTTSSPTGTSSPVAMVESPSSSSSSVDLKFEYLSPSMDTPSPMTTPSPDRGEKMDYPEASEPVFAEPPEVSSSGSSVAGFFNRFGFAITTVIVSVAWYGGSCI